MRRMWILAILGALVLAAGCRTPGQYRAAILASNIVVDQAYGAVYGAWLDDLVDTGDKDWAAAIRDRYVDAANATLDAVLSWEAMDPAQPWAPADVLLAARRTTALVAAIKALAAEARRRDRTSGRIAPTGATLVSRRPRAGARTTRRWIWAMSRRAI